MNHENTNNEHIATDSPVFNIPEIREYSAETDNDRSQAEVKLGSGVVNILIEQVPFDREVPVEVHHSDEVDIKGVPDVARTSLAPVSGTPVAGSKERERVVLGNKHPNPPSIFGHPSNTTDQKIRNIAGR